MQAVPGISIVKRKHPNSSVLFELSAILVVA